MDLPEITEAKRLALRPGDSLVIRLDREPSECEADEIAERVRELAGVPVLVLGPSMDAGVAGAEAGDPEPWIRMLRDYIRNHGGSVQGVLGS